MEMYLYDDLYKLEETHWWHIAKRKTVLLFLKIFVTQKKSKLLDVGCGTGKNLDTFKEYAIPTGIDVSKEALRFCRARGLRRVFLADATKTTFAPASFEAITMLDVLEHVDDIKALKELHRILKKNGILILTVPAFSWLWSKWDEALHHKRRYTQKSLTHLLTSCGFQVLKSSYLYSFLVVPAILVRIIKSWFYPKKYPSDFQLSTHLVNTILTRCADLERSRLTNGSIPFGTSIIAVARKKSL